MHNEQFEKAVRAMAAEGWTRTDIVAGVSAVFAKMRDEKPRRVYGDLVSDAVKAPYGKATI